MDWFPTLFTSICMPICRERRRRAQQLLSWPDCASDKSVQTRVNACLGFPAAMEATKGMNPFEQVIFKLTTLCDTYTDQLEASSKDVSGWMRGKFRTLKQKHTP